MTQQKSMLSRLSANFIETSVVICSLSILCLMLFLVLARYVFGWSVVGVLELVMIFGIWLYMLGSLAASRKNDHLVVDLVAVSLMSERARCLHRIVISLITGVICVFFMVWSYKMLMWGMKRPQVTPGLSIPLWIPQSAIMLASVGSFLYAVRDLIVNIKNFSNERVRKLTETV